MKNKRHTHTKNKNAIKDKQGTVIYLSGTAFYCP